jgi:hypothetical protein
MALLFFESAFSICLGCKIFNLVKKEKATHCPGDVCEMKIKEPIQKFDPVQKVILVVTVVVMVYGAYAYMVKLPDRTNLTKKIKRMMTSDAELQRIEDEKADREFEQEDF